MQKLSKKELDKQFIDENKAREAEETERLILKAELLQAIDNFKANFPEFT